MHDLLQFHWRVCYFVLLTYLSKHWQKHIVKNALIPHCIIPRCQASYWSRNLCIVGKKYLMNSSHCWMITLGSWPRSVGHLLYFLKSQKAAFLIDFTTENLISLSEVIHEFLTSWEIISPSKDLYFCGVLYHSFHFLEVW